MIAFFSDYTIQNVALGAALLGISSGVLGSFAVLRQQSLLGDTLSHAALPGVCLGFLVAGTRNLGSMLAGALITGVAAALFMVLLTRRSRIKTDAALGSALSIFFALGVVLLRHIQNSNNASQSGLDSFLFGQAATILRSDVWLMASITALALFLVIVIWKEIKLVTFDPTFAATLGLPVLGLELFLTAMIAFAVIIGLQMVGVVLMAAMIIAPAVAARQWVNSLEGMVILAAIFGAVGGITGALISALGRGLATGPLIILAISLCVLISILFAPQRGVLWEMLRQRRNRRQVQHQQVLTTLYKLAREHNNPQYQVEIGMLSAYYRHSVQASLHHLRQQNFVEQGRHMPEEGKHWQLTSAGYAEAKRVLESLNPQSPQAMATLEATTLGREKKA